jgi:hypothetical protein
MEDNDNIVNEEYRRLKELGYDGDIFDKMFKSARYYFRKKSTEKKAPVKRRIYVGSQKELLETMDTHIKSNILSGEFKPSDGFDEFCKQNVEILKDQVNLFIRAGISDSTLSVEISKRISSNAILSPTFLCHLVMVPVVIDSPIWGITISCLIY